MELFWVLVGIGTCYVMIDPHRRRRAKDIFLNIFTKEVEVKDEKKQ